MKCISSPSEPRRPSLIWIATLFGAIGLGGFLLFGRVWILAIGVAIGVITFIADRLIPRW